MDIKRLKQLAGLAPLVEAWGEGDFGRYMDQDEPEDEVANDHEPKRGLEDIDDFDGEDDLGSDEDLLPRVQPRSDAKKAASAIAAMRQKSPVSTHVAPTDTNPEQGEADMDSEPPSMSDQDMQTAVDTKQIPATEPGLDKPVLTPPATGGTKNPDLNLVRGDKASKAREWIAQNAGARRGDFMKWAAANLNMGPHYANTFFYANKKKVSEFYVVINPKTGKVLAEGSAFDIPVWTSYEKDSMFEPGILTQFQAKIAQEKLAEFGHKTTIGKKSVNEQEQSAAPEYSKMIGKKLKFKSNLKEYVGTLSAIEHDRAYFTDLNGDIWSTATKNIKL